MSRRARRRLALLLALGLAGVTGPVARAHVGHDVVRAERYIKFDANSQGLRVVVSLNLGPEETLRMGRRADEDQDGVLEPDEVREYMDDWADELRRELPIRVDGSFVRVPWAEPYMDPIGPVAARPGSLEMVANVPLIAGRHDVLLTDEMRIENLDRTDVAFAARDGATLLASGPSDAPTEIVESFAFGRTADRRRVHNIGLTITIPEPPVGTLPRVRPRGPLGPMVLIFGWSFLAVAIGRVVRAARAERRRRTS